MLDPRLGAFTAHIISYPSLTFPQQGKHCHPTGCTLPLPHRVFQKHSINRFQMVLWESLLTNYPLRKSRGNIRAAGTADIVWTWAGERLITWDHNNQQIRVTISPACGRSKMTLRYDQMAFLFSLLGHFPQRRLSMAKRLWIYFSTECKIREVYQAKHTNSTKIALGVVTALFTKKILQILTILISWFFNMPIHLKYVWTAHLEEPKDS